MSTLAPRPVSPALLGQLVRFALVGASNTAITFVSYAALTAAGAPAVVAAALGWALGAANGYRLNRGWTFRSRRGGARLAARYVAVQGLGAGVDALVVVTAVGAAHEDHLVAQLVALPPATALTFILCRRWIFVDGTPQR
jgi:putative flippase GtrA